MRFIAHRGNTEGAKPELENTLSYLEAALKNKFDIEVDVFTRKGQLYLGHDTPKDPINIEFLTNRRVWCHAKDEATFLNLIKFQDLNVFWQQDDKFSITSRGYIWTHSKCSKFVQNSVATVLDYKSEFLKDKKIHGICSDIIQLYRDQYTPQININTLPFDLLVLDIDGVMTNGTKLYGPDGEIIGKRYCDLDFTAIKRFKAAGIQVCFLSGDTNVNQKMAEIRKIDFYHSRDPISGSIDKSLFLPKLEQTYNVPRDKIAYVGDDYYDLSIIENLKWTFCPKTAALDLKKRVHKVLDAEGGHGVVAKLYEEYASLIDYAYPIDSFNQNNKQ